MRCAEPALPGQVEAVSLVSSFSDANTPSDEEVTDTIRMRIGPSDRERMVQAAELSGMTLATFVRASAAREAGRILREHRTTTLPERDSLALLEALDNPSPESLSNHSTLAGMIGRIFPAGWIASTTFCASLPESSRRTTSRDCSLR